MPVEIRMPQQSDTMTEGTLVRWLKKEGDKVRANEMIAEIETDKAVMEMETYDAGTLALTLVKEGERAPVGALLAVLAGANEKAEDVKKQYAGQAKAGGAGKGQAAAAAPAAPQAAARGQAAAAGGQRGAPPAQASTFERASRGELHEPDEVGHGATRETATAVPPVPRGGGDGNGERQRVSPLARRIAADKGVDLSQIKGSGPGGRIVQRDVLEAAEHGPASHEGAPQAGNGKQAAGPEVAPRVPRGEAQRIPLTKMRSAIAAALQRSKQNVPHYYETVDVDVEELSALRVRLNKQLEPEGVKLSLGDFVTKAVCAALLRHPAVNAHFTGDSITRFGDVNLGIAVAIPDGLIVPVLRGADQMGLKEIRQRSAELVKKAQAQPPRLKGDEMKGATFTISNLGMYGVREFAAIINPPEVAILAVGTAQKRAVARGDQIVARTVMSLTLSADHRAVDGAVAAEFLRTLKGLLEEPGMMLV